MQRYFALAFSLSLSRYVHGYPQLPIFFILTLIIIYNSIFAFAIFFGIICLEVKYISSCFRLLCEYYVFQVYFPEVVPKGSAIEIVT